MKFDKLDDISLDHVKESLNGKIDALNKSFDGAIESLNDSFEDVGANIGTNVANWLNIGSSELSGITISDLSDTVKQMYNGKEGTLGLKEISEWKTNPKYVAQNIKQQSGYAAEVISTAKENMIAKVKGIDTTTFRADDRPDLFQKNDQYVDKIRVDNKTGQVLERIQSKFVGKNGAECLRKLASKDFDKYFESGKIDKMEIPKDYYDEIVDNNLIEKQINKLQKQLKRVKAEGKDDVAEQKQKAIDKYKKINEMLERSTVSSDEAQYARLHPKRYAAKLFAKDVAISGNEIGKTSGLSAAALTAAVSTVDNVKQVMSGEITATEAFVDVAEDTAKAGAIGYATGFVSGAVSEAMSYSSHQLIKSVANSGIPAAVISFGVASFDSVVDYAQGTIDAKELAYDLGGNAASVAGGAVGAALAGAALGSIVPGAGTVAGFAVGLVGGMVGTAITSEVYQTAVELGAENADIILDKVKTTANETIDMAKNAIPDKVDSIKNALNNFTKSNNIPISF